ncbi:MAG: tyrosine-type recombinase/integrase [Clostridiales bacterium]|nr:tyrosine-type recombinase/integrase [Clostridiales bacterium]
MHREYDYSSVFSGQIKRYIGQRRESGFLFDNQAYWLSRFDRFCIESDIRDPLITKGLFERWSEKSPDEGKTTQYNRMTALRGFCIYMNTNGVPYYVPHVLPRPEKTIPYLMDDEAVLAFFHEVDACECRSTVSAFRRLTYEYRILFRLIYCCGLRNSEACTLKMDNIDTGAGFLTVIHSKGDKDRIVYLADDLRELCHSYREWLADNLGFMPVWFFPGKDPDLPIPKTSVDRKFNEFWQRTGLSRQGGKKPTVHSLRHAYVMKRMNLWMSEEIDFQVMLPYLSSYLGHSTPEDTFYYYYQTEDAFRIIRKKDLRSGMVIPEVPYE